VISTLKQYVGPGTLPVLLREKMVTVCHSPSFTDADTAHAFEKAYPGAMTLSAQTPEALNNESMLKSRL
jgi:hypothetical protein